MGIREFDHWLAAASEAEDETRRLQEETIRLRFRSLWRDMQTYIADKGYSDDRNRARLAAYALWYSTPEPLRPIRFQKQLAQQLGMSDDEIFRKWRKAYPDLFDDAQTRKSVEALIAEEIPNIAWAAVQCATRDGPQGFQDRQMLLKLAKLLPQATRTEISGPDGGPIPYRTVNEISDEELARIATSGC